MHRYCCLFLKLAFILVKSKLGSAGVPQFLICPSMLLESISPSGALNKQAEDGSQHGFTMKYLSMVRTSGNSLGTASVLELSIWTGIILFGRFGLDLNSAFCQMGKSTCGWVYCGVCGLQMYVPLHPSLLTHPVLSSSLGRHLWS